MGSGGKRRGQRERAGRCTAIHSLCDDTIKNVPRPKVIYLRYKAGNRVNIVRTLTLNGNALHPARVAHSSTNHRGGCGRFSHFSLFIPDKTFSRVNSSTVVVDGGDVSNSKGMNRSHSAYTLLLGLAGKARARWTRRVSFVGRDINPRLPPLVRFLCHSCAKFHVEVYTSAAGNVGAHFCTPTGV